MSKSMLLLCVLAMAAIIPALAFQSPEGEAARAVASMMRSIQSVNVAEAFAQQNGMASFAEEHELLATGFGVQATCEAATASLIRNFQACNATLASVELFYQTSTPGTQATVGAYCTAACKLAFEASLVEFAASCTVAQIRVIEAASLISNPRDPFRYRAILAYVRLPCVSRALTATTKEYCLPTFVGLIALVGSMDSSVAVTSTQLTGVCTPCLGIFLAAYSAFAPVELVKNFAFIDLFCTKDGSTWCAIETRELKNVEEGPVKIARICSTQCLSKILVKSLAAADVFNTTTVAERAEQKLTLSRLAILCSKNAAGQVCATAITNLDASENTSLAAGCLFAINQCPSTCKTFAANLIGSIGCCFQSFVDLASGLSDSTEEDNAALAATRAFISTTCGVTIPGACSTDNFAIRATLTLTNLKYAWYLTNAVAFRLKLLADIAAIMGTSPDVLSASVSAGTASASGSGFSTQASSVIVYISGSAATASAANSQYTSLTTVINDQSIALPGVSTLTSADADAKDDSSQAVGVNYASSSVTPVQQINGASGASSPSLVALLATAAATIVAAARLI